MVEPPRLGGQRASRCRAATPTRHLPARPEVWLAMRRAALPVRPTHRWSKPGSNSRSLWRGKLFPAEVKGRRPIKVVSKRAVPSSLRNQWFESISLQRRVCLSPQAARVRGEPRLSAEVCAAGLATGSAETRRLFRYLSSRRQYLCRAIFQYRSAADGVGGNIPMVPTKWEPSPGLIVR